MEEQIGITGEKTSKKDCLIIKYEGSSFQNKMELHAFSKQVHSVEKMLKEGILQLKKNNKIIDKPEDVEYYIEVKPGSFVTDFLILFASPIIVNIVSDLIIDYFKFLFAGNKKSEKYNKEIISLSESKAVRKATSEIINPSVNNSDKTIIIQGGNNSINNILIIREKEQNEIKKSLKEIEERLPTKEIEKEIIGRILKIDASKTEGHLDQSKLGFVVEGENDPTEAVFNKKLKEEEVKDVLFERIKIEGIFYYKGEDLTKIMINNYSLSPIRTLSSSQ
jgi:hypothetical protein